MKSQEGRVRASKARAARAVDRRDDRARASGGTWRPMKRQISVEDLKQLVAPPVAARASARSAAASAEPEVTVTSPVQFDDANRALVRISLDGSPTASATLGSLQQIRRRRSRRASDLSYGPGLVEAYVPVEQLLSVARTKGVLAVVPSSPMVTNVGATDSQGIVQHRVNKLPAGVDGSGITVGVMSDSYDTNAAPNSAALDIASGDLPGVGQSAGQHRAGGRPRRLPGAHRRRPRDAADRARSRAEGETRLRDGEHRAAGLRQQHPCALAGDPAAPNFRAGFKADVIVDDIIYLAEPFFQDGIVAQAVDEVVAKGVSYFSSAGNRPATQAYDSRRSRSFRAARLRGRARI